MKLLIFALLVVTSAITNFANQQSKIYNERAVQANIRASRLGTLNYPNLRRKDLALKVIKILDSAISLDRAYPYPYINKVASLIELNLYSEAIKNVNKTIALSPNFQPAYFRAGLIYQYYIKDSQKAGVYYKKAYDVANIAAKNKDHLKLDLDLNVAHALFFYKGKVASIDFLNSITNYYQKDPKSRSNIESFKVLINQPITEMNLKSSFSAYFK